jgi:hypothetical protein
MLIVNQNPRNELKKPLLIFFLAVVAAIESVWILKSNGFYYIDECAHFLFSRFALQTYQTTAQIWHRPLPRWLFALPAQFGHTATMFFALALYLCLLVITYRIAVLKGIKHAEWIVLLTGLQPVLFNVSYSCLTEMPTAFVIALSYLFYLKSKHGWSLAIASMAFLSRSEMYAFAVLMFLIYLHRREWKILPLVLVGPLLWIGAATIINGDITALFRDWINFSKIGKFVPGVSVAHYMINLYATFGIVQLIFFIAGIAFIAKAKRNKEFFIPYATLGMAIVIYTLTGADVFHWTGSIGELRYMAVVGPFFAIVSVYGLSEILERLKSARTTLAISLIVLAAVALNCTLTTQPRRWPLYEQIVIDITKSARAQYPQLTLLSNNCAAAYTVDVPPSGGPHLARFDKRMLAQYPECLILWDPYSSYSIYSQTELTKEMMLADTTVRVLQDYSYSNSGYFLLYRNARPIRSKGRDISQ